MSDLDQLSHLIEGILTGNNQVVKQNEALLKQLKAKDVDQYIILFANLLNGKHYSPYISTNYIKFLLAEMFVCSVESI